ncbi:MAG TPA: DUF1707 domain-containing protein [Trebonia sp.]|jgi:hypothetical protein|nr:DUF1707 domain-containing protein [Trebonia sp.]
MDEDPRGLFPPGDLRVSDAERDLAVSELSQAFHAGRLSQEEFEERCEQAFASRTGNELTALLADLPVERTPAEAAIARRPDRVPSSRPRVVVGATVAATAFALVSVANAVSPGPSLHQRELAQQILMQHGISVPLPPAAGFNWAGTITPAIISLAFVMLIVFLRATRDRRT